MVNRCNRIRSIGQRVLISILLIFFTHLWTSAQFDNVEIQTIEVVSDLYMLEGAGGNIGLLIGDDGAVMIDDQYAPLSEKILTAIGKLTSKPVIYVVNTHWHGDHTGGNKFFAESGATIVAHDNVRSRMRDNITSEENIESDMSALPIITFSEEMKMNYNDEVITLIHVHNAHTDGDSFVYFPFKNVIHMGDCFFHKRYPYIDLRSGGSVSGVIEAVKIALFMIDEETVIIPGHGPLASRRDLETYLTFLNTLNDRITAEIEVGKSLEEIDPAIMVRGYEDWRWQAIDNQRITEIFYQSISGESDN